MDKYFREIAKELNVDITDDVLRKFMIHMSLLKEWNEKINLTAITEEKDIVLKHFIDSLTILKYIPDDSRVIDVGTGAGFPGIPIKIMNSSLDVTLLDSLNKRIIFLEDVISKCELNLITCIHGRAEEFNKKDGFKKLFDVVTARAVANTSKLCTWCLPFLKPGGCFICMKGSNMDELDEAKPLIARHQCFVEKIDHFYLPGSDIERNIIIIRKKL